MESDAKSDHGIRAFGAGQGFTVGAGGDHSVTSEELRSVVTFPLRVIPGELGAVLHMIRPDSSQEQVGEVYFSEVEPGVIKGWKNHRRMTQRIAVPVGEVIFYTIDRRSESGNETSREMFRLGREENYKLLVIPPGVWYAFANVSGNTSVVANAPDSPHEPGEIIRKDLTAKEFAEELKELRRALSLVTTVEE